LKPMLALNKSRAKVKNQYLEMDSNLPAHYWRNMLERATLRRGFFAKKAAWTSEIEEEVDELIKKIEHYEEMLEWCDIRDNDYWSWDEWCLYLANKKAPKVNKILGTLPVEEEGFGF